jgi:hypothetical protein
MLLHLKTNLCIRNNPSLLTLQQAEFIKKSRDPLFQTAKLKTTQSMTIIAMKPDINCYLNDAARSLPMAPLSFVQATLYIYSFIMLFQIKMSISLVIYRFNRTFNGDLKWHLKEYINGSMRN